MHMRKSLSAAFLMTLCGASTAFAVPARPEPVKYTQPDGSVIMVRIEGDEFSHRYFTADNTPFVWMLTDSLNKRHLTTP